MILYIANRGEIARRIIRSAKAAGFKTAVGYADCDRDLPFVREADLAIALKGDEALETYLHFEKVAEAALQAGAQFLHPGYGFLSENADFADYIRSRGIEFVGPTGKSMRLLGDKVGARKFLKNLNVPLLPSYEDENQDPHFLLEKAKQLGFPLLIKPSAGGGGKGMFAVYGAQEFLEALASSKRIAASAFKDDRVFLERYIPQARHIEVQIIADQEGNIFALGERECSIQRKHQKVFEETPCDYLPQKLRERILEDSKRIIKAADYFSAATVEWIWDGKDGIYFLEVNARLQVEHPVTEEVWKVDLVNAQLQIALKKSLTGFAQTKPYGHAIEARLCAEDPSQSFLPSGGKILALELPEHLRLDFGYQEKNPVPSQFDSLIGKLIAYGESREEALARLQAGLESLVLLGPTTNRSFLIQILESKPMRRGEIHTRLLEKLPYQFPSEKVLPLLSKLAAHPEAFRRQSPLLENEEDLDLYSPWGSAATSKKPSKDFWYEDFGSKRYFWSRFADWAEDKPELSSQRSKNKSSEKDLSLNLRAPMPSKIIKVFAQEGRKASKGEPLMVLEAMKMEHQLRAPFDLLVTKIHFKEGNRVQADDLLLEWTKEG